MTDDGKLFWFKFYPAEFLSSPEVQGLTLEEQGGLLRLWCCYFRLRDNFPNDFQKVSRMTQVPPDACAMLLHQFFEQGDDGTWFSDRLQRELEQSIARSDRGREAADKRWRKKRKPLPDKKKRKTPTEPQDPPIEAYANAMLTQCELDIDADRDSAPALPVSDGSPNPETIHSESVVVVVEPVSLSGSDRQTRSYASTSEPIPAGDILQGIFRRGAV